VILTGLKDGRGLRQILVYSGGLGELWVFFCAKEILGKRQVPEGGVVVVMVLTNATGGEG